eukprot:Opistho-2@32159
MGSVAESRRPAGGPPGPMASSSASNTASMLVHATKHKPPKRPPAVSVTPPLEDDSVSGWDDGVDTFVADDVDLAKWDSLSQPSRLAWLEQCCDGASLPSCIVLGESSDDDGSEMEDAPAESTSTTPQQNPQSQIFNFSGTTQMPQLDSGTHTHKDAMSTTVNASEASPSADNLPPRRRKGCSSAPPAPPSVLGLSTLDIVQALTWVGNFEKVVTRRCGDDTGASSGVTEGNPAAVGARGGVRSGGNVRQLPSSAPADTRHVVLPYKFKYMRRGPDAPSTINAAVVGAVVVAPPPNPQQHQAMLAAIAAATSPMQAVALPTSMVLQYAPATAMAGASSRFLANPMLTESALEARRALAPRVDNGGHRGYPDGGKTSGLPSAQAATVKDLRAAHSRHRMTYTVSRGDDSDGEGAIAYKGGSLFGGPVGQSSSAKGGNGSGMGSASGGALSGWDAKLALNAPLAIVHEGDKSKPRKVGVVFPSVQTRMAAHASSSPPRASSFVFPPKDSGQCDVPQYPHISALTKHATPFSGRGDGRSDPLLRAGVDTQSSVPRMVSAVRIELMDTMAPVACGKNLGSTHGGSYHGAK